MGMLREHLLESNEGAAGAGGEGLCAREGVSHGYSQCCATEAVFLLQVRKEGAAWRKDFCSLLIHPLRLVQHILTSLSEGSSGSQGEKCWWDSRAQRHCTRFCSFYLCYLHSFQPCLSPASCSVSNTAHQKCLGRFSPNHGVCWDLLSWPKPSPEV